ncbi:MAG: galactofuranosyltransferase [Muribaculum sp.]|nr:galactofuranosyltransferase [Muribaculaceae bacterium]MCM1081691.1 galactofuranosyltransferase [Muribaculum sp.]
MQQLIDNLIDDNGTRLCYVSHNYPNKNYSGSKAKSDNEITLHNLSAVNLGLPQTSYSNKAAHFAVGLASVLKAAASLRKGDVLLLQYPLKKYFTFLCRVARGRGAKTVAIIHDLGSMRRRRLTPAKEIARLSNADYIIASNEVMRQWLLDHGMKRPTGSLGLFDFISAAGLPKAGSSDEAPHKPVLVYAGALGMRKNSFLLKMPHLAERFTLRVYGNAEGLPGLTDTAGADVRGFLPQEEFIAQSPGNFGLVWDGDSLDCCSGNFGEYLRWNSPHKASFYLRAGIPLIVWQQSAIAPIVKQLGVGVVAETIAEAADKLQSMTPQQYSKLKANACLTAARLQQGYFFTQALRQAISTLSKI